ncbi:MAG: hypothetical protein E6J70_04235 [Deltaproteobacteria bacterium]|nr:MAG: hypothetical protein E6J70_04235 [Deltaproteobacteria bacterium]
MRASVVLALASLLCAAHRSARAAYIDSNLAVSPETQQNGGGCYPQSLRGPITEMLNLINPEWAAIDVDSHLPPESEPVTLHGTVALAKINEGGDFPADHVSDDQNTLIDVDSADMALVATGNVGPHGEEAGTLEWELEIVKYPFFAWAGVGDRLTTVGRWIWDCGHPDPDPLGSCSISAQDCIVDSDCLPGETCVGTVFNYHSEIHPPQAVMVSRTGGGHAFAKRRRGGRRATRTDVWISPDGGGAGDRCVVTHHDNAFDQTTIDCFPLSEPLANVNASNVAFDIPLPPRPPGSLRPRVKVIDQTPAGLRRPRVTTTFVDGAPPVVHAVIDMTTPIAGMLPSRVGKTIFARWLNDTTPMARVRVTVTAIEILNPLKPVHPTAAARQRCSSTSTQDCSATPCPAGETCRTFGGPIAGWEIFLEANGHWQPLAALAGVTTPATIPQGLVFDAAVPVTGGTPHLHATGHSLDCRETMYGMSLNRDIQVFGGDVANCLEAESHDVGELDVTLPASGFPARRHPVSYVTQSIGGDGGQCSSTSSQLCLTNADCPSGETCTVTGGSYKLHYTIARRS